MSTDPREFEHPIDGTGGTVTPLADVIAGVIADNSITFNDSRDYGEMTASTLMPDEMARAVLAALSEAAVGFVALGPDNLGGVEFVDCMPTIAPNIESARSEIADWYADATPYALIPWTAVEG